MKRLILGPPGTGKTTRLLHFLQNNALKRTSAQNIAFFSFTRKAISEAKARASAESLSSERLPYFKTIHAMAYKELGLNSQNTITGAHFKRFSELTGYQFSRRNVVEEGFQKEGDKLLYLENYSRLVKKPLKAVWRELNFGVSFPELKLFVDNYNAYKNDNYLLDFTDMLKLFVEKGNPLPVKFGFVDEAQDLSPLQWDVVNKALSNATDIYYAGDDDQALYTWAGADAQQFINLKVDAVETLPVSHRLPRKIHALADKLIKQIPVRFNKIWEPRDEEGIVTYHADFSSIDFNLPWLILARDTFSLWGVAKKIRAAGRLYSFKNKSSIDEEHKYLIESYIKLQKGERIGKRAQDNLNRYFDAQTPWHSALLNISLNDRRYYHTLLQKGHTLEDIPTLQLNTIHGAKGGEADRVLLLTDTNERIYETYQQFPDNEHRVFYVGVTRAKKELHIMTPQNGDFYYDL